MISCTLFPENKKILPLWINIWFFLFLLGISLISPFFVSSVSSSSDFNFTSWAGGANIGIGVGLSILMLATIWDIILFSRKAMKPMGYLYRSMVFEEDVDDLGRARRNVFKVLFLSYLSLFLCSFSVLLFVCGKCESIKSSIISDESARKYTIFGCVGVFFLFSILSFIFKDSMTKSWDGCIESHPHRNLSVFACAKPGPSKIWFVQFSILYFLITGVLLGGLIYGKVSSQSSQSSDMKISEWKLQTIIALMMSIIIMIACNFVAYLVKGRSPVNEAMKKQFLFPRDAYELVQARRSLSATSAVQLWLFFLWVAAATLISLSCKEVTEKLTQISSAKSYLEYCAIGFVGVMFLSILIILSVQGKVRLNFERCNSGNRTKNVVLGYSNLDS